MQRQFLSLMLLLLMLPLDHLASIKGAHPTHTDYSNLHGEKVNFDFLELTWDSDSTFILNQLTLLTNSHSTYSSLSNMINEAPPQIIMSKRKLKLQRNQDQNPLYIQHRNQLLSQPSNSTVSSLAWLGYTHWSPAFKTRLAVNAVLFTLCWFLEFGIVCFTLSALYWIFYNTSEDHGSSARSAYSVFNEGFERLAGDRSAEDVERELRNGILQ